MKKLSIILIVVVIAGGAAWWFLRKPVAPLPWDELVFLDTGMDATARDIWWHQGEGSGVLPLPLLLSLTNVDTRGPYLESVAAYGMVPDSTNTFGLPIGLAIDDEPGPDGRTQMVGINCAACHTGIFTFERTGMVIDGAPNMMDVEVLIGVLARSVAASVVNPIELLALIARSASSARALEDSGPTFEMAPDALVMLNRLVAEDADAEHVRTREHVQQVVHSAYGAASVADAEEIVRNGMGAADTAVGHPDHLPHTRTILQSVSDDIHWLRGRVASLEIIAKAFKNATEGGPGRSDSFDIIWDMLVQHDSIISLDSPVSTPDLFDYARRTWVHWDGNTNTVFSRNFAQAVALGASYDPATGESHVEPRGLMALEAAAHELTAPEWPEEILGDIDRDLAATGEEVFANQCAGCHSADSSNFIPVEEVGTDPLRTRQFADLRVGSQTYPEALTELGERMTRAGFEAHNLTPEEIALPERVSDPVWRATLSYNARPIRAVWASPPYLHNGSVPTIWDLLQPASNRPTTFPVGRELDPTRVGISVTNQPKESWLFDTSIKGNSNSGHEFGVDLTDDQKWALIEYLKIR